MILDSLDRTEDITIEEIKRLETFKNWDERQISELVIAMKTLSTVLYNSWAAKNTSGKEIVLNNDNQTVIKEAA